jgi:pimeloyl-ACP methyl ester carboxylesterase
MKLPNQTISNKLLLVLWITTLSLPLPLFAQDAADQLPPLAEPEQVEFTTGDGVQISATYYPGKDSKETVPIVLIHGFGESRASWGDLPLVLQEHGYSVLVPDIRGHGRSTKVAGMRRPLEAKSLPKAAINAMPGENGDIEACKAFLKAKNDAGQLNLNKLCLVGSEMGSTLALDWAGLDWSWEPLANKKQGQDVKGLVLISPSWAFRGIQIRDALADPIICRDLGIYIIVGEKKAKPLREAERLYATFKRCRPGVEDLPPQNRNLFIRKVDTSLQGTSMITIPDSPLSAKIAKFIELAIEKKNFPWIKRTHELK